MRKAIIVVIVASSAMAWGAAAQNLLADPSFETGNVPSCAQGWMPDTWFTSSVSPDTYSFDCATLAGLAPGTLGNFTTIASAYDGLRFAAGAELGFVEGFGQLLAQPLTPGQCYALSGYFVRADRGDIAGQGVYDIYLSPTTSAVDGILVASIGDNAVQGMWTHDMVEFNVPDGYAGAAHIIMSPRTLVGGGSYLGSDSWELTTICTVPVEHGTWGAVKALFGE